MRCSKSKQVPPGSVIVAGKNFGCGSSREQAASCLKGHELTIVARGFARIFLQNAINLGLRIVTAPDLQAEEGDELEVGAEAVANATRGVRFAVHAAAARAAGHHRRRRTDLLHAHPAHRRRLDPAPLAAPQGAVDRRGDRRREAAGGRRADRRLLERDPGVAEQVAPHLDAEDPPRPAPPRAGARSRPDAACRPRSPRFRGRRRAGSPGDPPPARAAPGPRPPAFS